MLRTTVDVGVQTVATKLLRSTGYRLLPSFKELIVGVDAEDCAVEINNVSLPLASGTFATAD